MNMLKLYVRKTSKVSSIITLLIIINGFSCFFFWNTAILLSNYVSLYNIYYVCISLV